MKNVLRSALVLALAAAVSSCAYYKEQIVPPTAEKIEDMKQIHPRGAMQAGVFHMQRVDDGPSVRVKDRISLKRPDLPPFDVVYTNRNVESILLELANVAGESIVLPDGLRSRTVTVIHSGADFQEMLDIILSKVGYHYNYVNGVWYVTRYPIRNYALEISQSKRGGSLISDTELMASEGEDSSNSTSRDVTNLDTEYEDLVWDQVEATVGELVAVGQLQESGAGNARSGSAVLRGAAARENNAASDKGVSQSDFVNASGTLENLLPPPTLTDGITERDIFAALTESGNLRPNTLPGVSGTDHLQKEEDATPFFRMTKSAGLITVRAAPEAHRLIEEYLQQVQETSNRQVFVEARIIAIVKDKTVTTGSNLKRANSLGGSLLGNFGFSTSTPLNAANVTGGSLQILSDNGAANADMDVLLQALSSVADVYTISSPTLLARNNQISRVSVTRQLGYAETEVDQNTTSTGDVIIGSRRDIPKFKNAGTVMSVMPYIGRSKVQLRYRLAIASQSGSTEIQTVVGVGTNAQSITTQVPDMANNIIDQDMVLDYGRIYAIGGLLESNTGITTEYVPGFANIPGVGEILQRAANNKQETEFLVLMRVVRS